MTLSTGEQAFLNILEGDALGAFGQPGITLIQNLLLHKGNLPAETADILAFVAQAPGAGITLGVEFEGQLLQLALTKLQTLVASKPAPAA